MTIAVARRWCLFPFSLLAVLASFGSPVRAQIPSELQQQLFPTDSLGRQLGLDLDADADTLVGGGGSRVYVYARAAGSWGDAQVIEPVSLVAGQNNWGCGVAVSGDLLAVGSQTEQNTNGGTGAVHIYQRQAGGNWAYQLTVVSPEPTDSTLFGAALDLEGEHLVVSDPFHRFGGPFPQGAVFTFEWDGTEFKYQSKLDSTTESLGDLFGAAVALHDGWLVVGAPQENGAPNLGDSGAAYVFQRTAATWTPVTRIEAQIPQSGAQFGAAVALAAETAAIGSPARTVNGQTLAGALHVFAKKDWIEVAMLTSTDPIEQEQFGASVSTSGNLVMAGRPNFSPTGIQTARGGVRVYRRRHTGWQLAEDLAAPDGENLDRFGRSVLIHDRQLIIGAAEDNVPAPGGGTIFDWGSLYLFGGGSVSEDLFADGFEAP
ncbi:MAG: hypothetical protein KDI51_08330 [Xanthomonadales bacterium]|nr:hypothetical protein [Xanthomonadales bacterium]